VGSEPEAIAEGKDPPLLLARRLALRESPPPTAFERVLGGIGARAISAWLWVVGRRLPLERAPFLDGPIGPAGRIGVALYDHIASVHGLTIRTREGDGLVPDFGALGGPRFDPGAVHPAIRDFYEHTARYRLDAWAAPAFAMAPFLWLLVRTVSRSVDQLNFPVSPLEVSRGMSSDVLAMEDSAGLLHYTGWLRRLGIDGRVLYAGFYTTASVTNFDNPCVKVVFPMPGGSATVLLRPENGPKGSFRLVSSGRRFGDPGFYRLRRRGDRLCVRYLRTLREEFDVYVDDGGELRCDHRVSFLGLRVLTLHYRMTHTS
jgi:hypothetical protein